LIARELFHQALNKDKSFAIAYSGLADTYLLSSYRGYQDPDIMLPLAKKNIDIALSLDSSSGEIQATLGYWFHQSFDWKEAEKTYRKAIELNPNQSNVYLWLAILLEAKEEKEEAIKIYDKGSEVNPVWDYLMQNKVRALANGNNQEEAIRLQKHLIEKAAYDPVVQRSRYINLSKLYWFFGNKEEAIATAEKAQNPGLTRFYRTGDYKLLEKEVDENYRVLRKSGEYISELWMGVEYAMAGAKEKALQCFNNAIVLENTAITLLLIRQYEFLNLKYLDLVRVTRKIKSLINF
jgi:tetratricopeptide (TPR) repeat protein